MLAENMGCNMENMEWSDTNLDQHDCRISSVVFCAREQHLSTKLPINNPGFPLGFIKYTLIRHQALELRGGKCITPTGFPRIENIS